MAQAVCDAVREGDEQRLRALLGDQSAPVVRAALSDTDDFDKTALQVHSKPRTPGCELARCGSRPLESRMPAVPAAPPLRWL